MKKKKVNKVGDRLTWAGNVIFLYLKGTKKWKTESGGEIIIVLNTHYFFPRFRRDSLTN